MIRFIVSIIHGECKAHIIVVGGGEEEEDGGGEEEEDIVSVDEMGKNIKSQSRMNSM